MSSVTLSPQKNWLRAFWPYLALAALFSVSILVRLPDIQGSTGAPGLQASFHMLLTTRALKETDASHHGWLPTVSLGQEQDKNISWGATIPNNHGDLIYTSFTPPAFVLGYAFLKAFHLPSNIKSLSILNFALQALSAVLLYHMLYLLLRDNKIERKTAQLCAISVTAIGFLSREALLSCGLIYWSQQLYQPILIASLLALYKTLRLGSNAAIVALCTLCFAGAWTEWTGFIFNGAVLVVLLYEAKKTHDRKVWVAFLGVLSATLIACLLILAHLSFFVGLDASIAALTQRFLARSTHQGSFTFGW